MYKNNNAISMVGGGCYSTSYNTYEKWYLRTADGLELLELLSSTTLRLSSSGGNLNPFDFKLTKVSKNKGKESR